VRGSDIMNIAKIFRYEVIIEDARSRIANVSDRQSLGCLLGPTSRPPCDRSSPSSYHPSIIIIILNSPSIVFSRQQSMVFVRLCNKRCVTNAMVVVRVLLDTTKK